MIRQKITFDSFIRGTLTVVIIALAVLLINRLSSVLLPFFIALLIAYLIYPIVTFFQYRCHLRNRALSIIVTLVLLIGILTETFLLLVPPMIEQIGKLKNLIVEYVQQESHNSSIPGTIENSIRNFLAETDLQNLFADINIMDVLRETIPQVMNIVSQTATIIFSIISACIILIYLFFILLDYESITKGWLNFIPQRHRRRTAAVFNDVKVRMNSYFRGQALIALLVGILFAIGFTLIDFPMAIGLGLFIGVLNLVPYLQTIGFIPTILLALLKAADTGENFWIILLGALAVFAVVQVIQDFILVPKIMGRIMGLNPAAILLSLTVWGALLGFIGLIIALPLTTLIITYYRHYLDESDRKRQDFPQKEAGNT